MASNQGIKLDDSTVLRLRALAEKRNRTPHWLMKAAIEKYLDEAEDYEREKSEDAARWEQYIITGIAVDHNDIRPWLGHLTEKGYKAWQE
jgi:predicted transcriptional regulator